MSTQPPTRDSLDELDDKIEQGFRFVTIISEAVLMAGLGYAGFKLAHRGATPEVLDQIWLVSQVLALDLSAPGLFAMATRAREQGNERRAKWAIRVAIVLIIMSILTMVEGAVTSYLPNIPQSIVLYVTVAMMVIRGAASVGYSVFRRLHKAANSAPVPVAVPQVEEHVIAAQLERLQQRIEQLATPIVANLPVPEPVQNEQLTHLLERISTLETQLNSAPIPDEIEPQIEDEIEQELPPNVTQFHQVKQPKITIQLPAITPPNSAQIENKKGPYVITKLEAAERFQCTIEDIERGIKDGVIQPAGRDPENKVLVSSLEKFTPVKRGRNKKVR